jgi:hypothetical protein
MMGGGMSKQEILPPIQSQAVQVRRPETAVVKVNVPGAGVSGGYITSALDRMRWDRASDATDALTRLNKSEVSLFNAQTQVTDAKRKRLEAQFALQELPEKLGHELAVRRVERAESYRQAQHIYEVNETRRATDLTLERTNLTRVRTALTDAEQQLQAQHDHGYLTYELAHRKKQAEILDVELSKKERRRLLQMDEPRRNKRDDYSGINAEIDAMGEIDDALHARRDQLNASGLDTDSIDEAIRKRKR